MLRLVSLLLAGLLATGSLTACNTMAGLGKDLQAAGQSLQKDAEEAKD